jgi:hypothetical protein
MSDGGWILGELLAGNDQLPYHVRELARLIVERILATDLLKKDMMKGKTDQEVADLIGKISSASLMVTNRMVQSSITARPRLSGLDVEYLDPSDVCGLGCGFSTVGMTTIPKRRTLARFSKA